MDSGGGHCGCWINDEGSEMAVKDPLVKMLGTGEQNYRLMELIRRHPRLLLSSPTAIIRRSIQTKTRRYFEQRVS